MAAFVSGAILLLILKLLVRDREVHAAEDTVWASTCSPRSYGNGKIVCVCNETYCDVLQAPSIPVEDGTAYVIQSSAQGERFVSAKLPFQPDDQEGAAESNDAVQVLVDPRQEFQEIIGFGGAFTDAAGINMAALPDSMRYDIVNSYYSEQGSEYNMGRVPMASCDFSTKVYSYNDVADDMELEHFQLAPEDLNYKIPFIQKAWSLSTQPLLLMGTPWAPPAWMKTNEKANEAGTLKEDVGGRYYQTWAKYFVKFLQAYQAHNLTFWGLSAQNEPMDGQIYKFWFQCLGFTPQSQATFVASNLGPALEEAGYGPDKIKLMILDDQRLLLPTWAKYVFSNQEASKYVSGIAFHWYLNLVAPAKLLDLTHSQFPDKFLLSSEACEGSMPWQKKVSLGDWGRAESYAHDIIEDLQHWTAGWVDWNLALDLQGGPNWVGNFVDAPIIVNATAKEFYKQPMYYALAHFSKFIKNGSKRLQSTVAPTDSKLEVVAVKTPQKTTVLVVLNRRSTAFNLEVREVGLNGTLKNIIPAHSIQTYLWNSGS